MASKIRGLQETLRKFEKLKKSVDKQARKSMRTALNAGAKEMKKTLKPVVPTLKSSTNFRQKGTVKNNVRHKTYVSKDGTKGYTVIGIMRPKGQKMARIGENTRDKRDPFYWWMVNYGTEKMEGQHFMEKAESAGKARAKKVAMDRLENELRSSINRSIKKL
ncbi:HK97-gp10 family putative phage morphogenesis protein [Lonepinella sp. BR2919]|uniref:HK97-gp10 family putative phage morphogenesis protein n=1 Tax=unclassified Lonepinella TaxID=2642006 RepID=UPI003F6E0922